MNKTVKILMLVSIFTLSLFGSSSLFAKELGKGEVGAMSQPMGWETFEASWLIGHQVYSPYGGEFGQIEDLMIDRTDGHIALVILSGVRGFGTGFEPPLLAPWKVTGKIPSCSTSMLSMIQTPTVFRILQPPMTIRTTIRTHTNFIDLEASLGYRLSRRTIDPLWADSVYQFYGQTPYWTEGKTPHPDIMSYRTARLRYSSLSS